MASEGGHGAQTSGEYISHHLQNLQVCPDGSGAWVWNQCAGNPMAINVDSMFWSVLLGLVFIWLFWGAARKSTAGKPTRGQALSLIHISEPTRPNAPSRMPSSA